MRCLSAFGFALAVAGCTSTQLPAPSGPTPGTAGELRDSLRQTWRYDATAAFGETPGVVIGDLVYVGTRHGEVHAIRLSTGKKAGLAQLFDAIETAPVVLGDSRVLVVPKSRQRPVVLQLGGSTVWTAPDRVVVEDAPVNTNLGVLVGTRDAGLFRYNTSGTGPQWERLGGTDAQPGRVHVAQSILLHSEVALPKYFVAVIRKGTARMYSYSGGYPEGEWESRLGGYSVSRPPLAWQSPSQRIAFPTPASHIVAYNLQRDTVLWTFALPDETVQFTELVANDLFLRAHITPFGIYVGATDGVVRSLNSETGALLWRRDLGDPITAAPTFYSGRLYVGTLGRKFFVLDAYTGEVLHEYRVGGRIQSRPLVYGAGVLVFAEPSHVYHFAPAAPEAPSSR